MERPFDYPGRHSEVEFKLKTRIGGFETHDDDGCGYTSFIVYEFSSLADAAEIGESIKAMHPETRCEHSYDCCGRFYAGVARWDLAPRIDYSSSETQTVLVKQRWLCNV